MITQETPIACPYGCENDGSVYASGSPGNREAYKANWSCGCSGPWRPTREEAIEVIRQTTCDKSLSGVQEDLARIIQAIEQSRPDPTTQDAEAAGGEG